MRCTPAPLVARRKAQSISNQTRWMATATTAFRRGSSPAARSARFCSSGFTEPVGVAREHGFGEDRRRAAPGASTCELGQHLRRGRDWAAPTVQCSPFGLRASCLPQIPCSPFGLRAEWREAVAERRLNVTHERRSRRVLLDARHAPPQRLQPAGLRERRTLRAAPVMYGATRWGRVTQRARKGCARQAAGAGGSHAFPQRGPSRRTMCWWPVTTSKSSVSFEEVEKRFPKPKRCSRRSRSYCERWHDH
jgi:hypothetical protein